MEIRLATPLTKEKLAALKAGDKVLLSGQILTARDAAHGRITDILKQNSSLPFELENACIYYAGPTPAAPGQVIGSAGPTTSGRMDAYTPLLLEKGMAAMIGKGPRNAEVMAAIKKHGAVYFGFVGGAGALAASHISKCEVTAWGDLGSEAVHSFTVHNFPLAVIADAHGGDLYSDGRREYLASLK